MMAEFFKTWRGTSHDCFVKVMQNVCIVIACNFNGTEEVCAEILFIHSSSCLICVEGFV